MRYLGTSVGQNIQLKGGLESIIICCCFFKYALYVPCLKISRFQFKMVTRASWTYLFPWSTESTATSRAIISEGNPATSWVSPIHRAREITHHREGRRGWHSLTMNPTPSTVTHNWEGIHHSQFPPEEQRIWTPHLAPHLLIPAPERSPPCLCLPPHTPQNT